MFLDGFEHLSLGLDDEMKLNDTFVAGCTDGRKTCGQRGQITYIDTILMWQIESYRTKRQIYQHIQHNINLTL